MLEELPRLWSAASADPVLFYSLASAVLLAVVSLYGGLVRLDVLALAGPRDLLRVVGAVALAFVLRAVAESGAVDVGSPLGTVLPGLHRLPLYVVALAYGPSAGLLSAALFAAFASSTLLPGLEQLVLALELVVLGWLAIFPSPRVSRWAGPVDAALAYALAWGTGGVALLAAHGVFVDAEALRSQHATVLPGVVLSCLLLVALGPDAYRAAFPRSRIDSARPTRGDTERVRTGAAQAPALTPGTDPFVTLAHHRARTWIPVPVGDLPRVRARVVKRLQPVSLPEDSLER